MSLTAAVIGTGYMGKQHLEIWNKLGVRVIICGTDEKTGAELANKYSAPFYTDYITMLDAEKPDAVSICLPTALHFDAAKAALERGTAVLCEKPFTETIAQAEELCRLAKSADRLLMVGHPLRFGRAYVYLKRCLDDKRFGELRQIHMYRHSEVPAWSVGSWLTKLEESGGAVKDMHIHESDIMGYLFGKPESVLTLGDYSASTTVYRYSGRAAAITASVSWRNAKGYPFTAGYDAVFDGGVIECRGTEVKLYTDDSECDPIAAESLPAYCLGGTTLENEIAYFCECVRSRTKPAVCMPEETLASMILNEAEITSLKSGREIFVETK